MFVIENEDKEIFLDIARETVNNYVKNKSVPDFEIERPNLKQKSGAFVTLKKNNQLRGCIGHLSADQEAWETVRDMAVMSCSKDHRFSPVTENELPNIDIEISVISPMEKIDDLNSIEVGKHGIYIKHGIQSGLLLPQVATEYGWDRNEFLKHTCFKAGLSPENIQDYEVFVFTADVFG